MLHELLASPLAVSPHYFEHVLLPQLEQQRQTGKEPEPFLQVAPQRVEGKDSQGRAGRVAVLGVSGVLTNSGYYGTGYYELQQQLRQAYADSSVAGILVVNNSPGGAVMGLQAAVDTVAGRNKPVGTWTDTMAASAAYRLAAPGDFIMLSDNAAQVGSIGTMRQHVSMQKAMEEWGYKVTFITATRSVDKTLGHPYQDLDEETVAKLQAELDEVNDDFIADVQAGRGKRLQTDQEDPFTGKMYGGRRAVALGLADGLGPLDQAVARVLDLARSGEFGRKQIASSTPDTMSQKFSVLTAALQAVGYLKPDEQIQANAATLEAADQALQAVQGELVTAQQERQTALDAQQTAEQARDAAVQARQTAEQTLQTQTAELQTLRDWKAAADQNQNPHGDQRDKGQRATSAISVAEQSVNDHVKQAGSYKLPQR